MRKAIKISILNLLKEVKSKSNQKKKKSGFFISTTAKKSSNPCVILPLRETNKVICGGITLYDPKISESIIEIIDGKVDYIILDAESKIKGMQKISDKLSSKVNSSVVLNFKNNDITVDATFNLISNLVSSFSKTNFSIIGTGNISGKIALKLIECESNIKIAGQNFTDAKKVANSINVIKTKNSLKKIIPKSKKTIAKNADILLGITPGIQIIDKQMIQDMNDNGIIIDVGIGTIFPSAIDEAVKKGIKIVRVDIGNSFSGMIDTAISTKKFLQIDQGTRMINDIRIVAGGLYGKKGDIVVDKIKKSTKIIGIADGKGGIISKKITPDQKNQIKIIEKIILKK